MNRPLVSVITSCYNSGNYIRSSIESVLEQDYANWEHIVIDCGSTDDSLEILARIAHRRLRVIQVPFCGVAEARNIGISEAKGEIIAVLDSDDYALPRRLTKQVNVLVSMPDIVGVGSGITRVNEVTNRSKTFIYGFSHRQLAILLHAGFDPIPHSSLAFRLSSYKAIGGYSDTIEKCEDFEFLIRLSNAGRLLSLPEPLVRCAHRESSHTNRHRPKGRDTMFYTVLALILNSVEKESTRPSQEAVERWLEGVGSDGIRAILGSWSLREIRQNIGEVDLKVLVYLTRILVSSVPSIRRSRRQEWWGLAKTPMGIATHCNDRQRLTGA